jgi:hypothetical protein
VEVCSKASRNPVLNAPVIPECTSGTGECSNRPGNAARGLVKSYGERLRKCHTQQVRLIVTSCDLRLGLRYCLRGHPNPAI